MPVLVVLLALSGRDPTVFGTGWLQMHRENGALGCPTTEKVVAAVMARLGKAPFGGDGGVRVRGSWFRRGGELVARVQLLAEDGSPAGVREIAVPGEDCGVLAASLTLSLALALRDLDSLPTPHATERSTRSAPSATDRVTASAAPAAGGIGRGRRWGIVVGALASAGALPGATAGGMLAVRLASGRTVVDAGMEAEMALPTRHGGATIGAWRASGVVVPCAMLASLRLCAVARAGALRAVGEQLALPRTVTLPVFELGLRTGFDFYRRSRWSLSAIAEGTAPLLRPRLLVDGREVWKAWPVGVTIGISASAW